jgi:DNA-binding SARP family transcriptional activator
MAVDLEAELTRGLVCASQAHYADAAIHFAEARTLLPSTLSPLLAALDAFIESHARYWKAQQALHEASHHFVLTSTDQEARLADLQEALVSRVNTLVELPPLTLLSAPEREITAPGGQTSSEWRITCFGRFEVWRAGERVPLCRNRNGQAVLRYLVAQRRHRETVDVLVDTFWPDDEPQVARHKLQVAVSALRRALDEAASRSRGGTSLIVYDNGNYALSGLAAETIDVDAFEAAYGAGVRALGDARIAYFTAACELYEGPFLSEDLYADWSLLRREQLTQALLSMCEVLAGNALERQQADAALRWASLILEHDRCNESAHRLLMRAYVAAGRRGQALKQYQYCERVLADEVGVTPATETTALFYTILKPDSDGM